MTEELERWCRALTLVGRGKSLRAIISVMGKSLESVEQWLTSSALGSTVTLCYEEMD